MSTVYNPEAETIAEIEKLEIELLGLLRRLARAGGAEDKRVLQQQIDEVQQAIATLRSRVP